MSNMFGYQGLAIKYAFANEPAVAALTWRVIVPAVVGKKPVLVGFRASADAPTRFLFLKSETTDGAGVGTDIPPVLYDSDAALDNEWIVGGVGQEIRMQNRDLIDLGWWSYYRHD